MAACTLVLSGGVCGGGWGGGLGQGSSLVFLFTKNNSPPEGVWMGRSCMLGGFGPLIHLRQIEIMYSRSSDRRRSVQLVSHSGFGLTTHVGLLNRHIKQNLAMVS